MGEKRKVIVTGAAGFGGFNLCLELLKEGFEVYAIVRPMSKHNKRLEKLRNDSLHIIEMERDDMGILAAFVANACDDFKNATFDYLFHMMWGGDRYDMDMQMQNVIATYDLVKQAKILDVKRIIAAGSQAEYGSIYEEQREDMEPKAESAYGKCKDLSGKLLFRVGKEQNIECIWARIFSLIGPYEENGRMFKDLMDSAKKGKTMKLSSCKQIWNYMDARDMARAFILLAEHGKEFEIYNVASSTSRPLREYTDKANEIAYSICGNKATIEYGEDLKNPVNLNPDISKLKNDTGFSEKYNFEDSVKSYF